MPFRSRSGTLPNGHPRRPSSCRVIQRGGESVWGFPGAGGRRSWWTSIPDLRRDRRGVGDRKLVDTDPDIFLDDAFEKGIFVEEDDIAFSKYSIAAPGKANDKMDSTISIAPYDVDDECGAPPEDESLEDLNWSGAGPFRHVSWSDLQHADPAG